MNSIHKEHENRIHKEHENRIHPEREEFRSKQEEMTGISPIKSTDVMDPSLSCVVLLLNFLLTRSLISKTQVVECVGLRVCVCVCVW